MDVHQYVKYASEGNLQAVRTWISNGNQVDAMIDGDRWSKTALYCAVEYNCLTVAKHLLEHGADITLCCGYHSPYAYIPMISPIGLIIYRDDVYMMREILHCDTSSHIFSCHEFITKMTNRFRSGQIACMMTEDAVCDKFIEHAILSHDFQEIERLCCCGLSANGTMSDGTSTLIFALHVRIRKVRQADWNCSHNDNRIIEILLKHGADITQDVMVDDAPVNRISLLAYAFCQGIHDVGSLLIIAGVNVDPKDAMEYASKFDLFELTKYLVRKGESVDIPSITTSAPMRTCVGNKLHCRLAARCICSSML